MDKPSISGIARRHDLDALRAFAMLLGILFHASLPYVTTGWMVSDWKQAEVLVSYHFLVRDKWIGWILNRRRVPRAAKV